MLMLIPLTPTLEAALGIAVLIVGAASVLSLIRLLIGPSMPDRILALDTLYVNTIALVVLFGLRQESMLYFEAALLIAVMGFIGTVALSKYLLRGDIME
jgi:multicomponent K+:H+ antiporter subunit F